MIKIENKYIPFKGFSAMAIYPFLFIRKGAKMDMYTFNHERIHFAQQIESFFLGLTIAIAGIHLYEHWCWSVFLALYYILYLLNYAANLIRYKNRRLAYYRIVFEQEAFSHEREPNYLQNRKLFCWIKLLLK